MNSARPRNDVAYACVFPDIYGEGAIIPSRTVMVANEH